MTSQVGSLVRCTRSAVDGRVVASGTVRSAILTYFDQIVIEKPAATKGSGHRLPPANGHCACGASTLSWAGRKHTGSWPGTQKRKRCHASPTPSALEIASQEE